ncbi:Rab GTPase [Tieghemostelium lacteum]|uniref:Rab GTPase n=1 Tax=Tieghemostelium lacteum TaxID=361077 RepID=A0A151ZJ46_TIELA|nr:Rab GTPase [Tieghemostelium lacteum]|eukprot:KYQ93937.1 Rab GTPase [Tieghemostelium lacteum]
MSCCDSGTSKQQQANIPVDNSHQDGRSKLEKGIKIVLLGEMNTGKTCIAHRLVRNEFGATDSTIGAAFLVKTLVVDNISVKLEIWDTAGQERYRSLIPMYYRGAAAAVIVYDITKKNTFEQSLKKWVTELQKHASPNLILALAGNKCDLPNREVSVDEVSRYISELGEAIFFETSAATNHNINELFVEICRKLINNYK